MLILAGFIFLAAPGAIHAAPPWQAPDTAPSVSGGRELWTENCLPCHGSTGQGDGPTAQSIPDPIPDFSDPEVARQYIPAENFDVIDNGRMDKLMPPWGNRLTDEQMWNAAAFVWSLSTTPQKLAAGEIVYLEQCAACHGETGRGDGPDAPPEIVDLTDVQAMVQKSQADLQANFSAGDQHEPLRDLPEEELWQALDYIRTFSFDVSLPQRNGVLTGQVFNATTGEPVGDMAVTLHVIENNAEIDTLTVQADSEGNYRFENLPTEHSILYAVEAEYQDIPYVSDQPGLFMPDTTETTLDLNVYEPTTSAEAISITQLHYLLSFTPDAVNAVQIFVIGNDSNQTYIGQGGQTFTFAVPDGVTGVTFQNDPTGTRFRETEAGYADTAPVLPGQEGSSIVVIYDIPYDGDSLTINLPLPADTTDLNILMSEQGASLSSEQVQLVETRQVQGNEFAIFNGGSMAKGDTLTLHLTGLDDLTFESASNIPGATVTTPPVNQNLLLWIIIGLGGFAIVGGGLAYPLMRPQLTHQSSVYSDDPELYRQKLLLMLARLDETFEAGELEEEVYHRARTKYKAELVEVLES